MKALKYILTRDLSGTFFILLIFQQKKNITGYKQNPHSCVCMGAVCLHWILEAHHSSSSGSWYAPRSNSGHLALCTHTLRGFCYCNTMPNSQNPSQRKYDITWKYMHHHLDVKRNWIKKIILRYIKMWIITDVTETILIRWNTT